MGNTPWAGVGGTALPKDGLLGGPEGCLVDLYLSGAGSMLTSLLQGPGLVQKQACAFWEVRTLTWGTGLSMFSF